MFTIDDKKARYALLRWTIKQPTISRELIVPAIVNKMNEDKVWTLLRSWLNTNRATRLLDLLRARAKAYRRAGCALDTCVAVAIRDWVEGCK